MHRRRGSGQQGQIPLERPGGQNGDLTLYPVTVHHWNPSRTVLGDPWEEGQEPDYVGFQGEWKEGD